MRALIRHAGLSQRAVAEYLRVGTGSAVCRAVTRLAQQMTASRELEKMVGEIDSMLAT